MKYFILTIVLIFVHTAVMADTWKPVSKVMVSESGTKMIWVEIRYDSYPNYYTRSLNEADCEKEQLRGVKSEVYTLDGKLVSSSVEKNVAPYFGWVPPIEGTPSKEIYDSICGK